MIGRVSRRPKQPIFEGFSMTISFPEMKTGLRLGLAAAATGCVAEEELGPSLAQMDPATKKENVLAFLIDMKIVAKAAEDKKFENGEDFKKRLAFTRNRLLMDSLLASEGKAATTDEAMKKVYEDASKQITGEQEVHARHILVETEDEAKAVA